MSVSIIPASFEAYALVPTGVTAGRSREYSKHRVIAWRVADAPAGVEVTPIVAEGLCTNYLKIVDAGGFVLREGS